MSLMFIRLIVIFCKCSFTDLNHAGEDCWNDCNDIQGRCEWCGNDGWCCRKEWIGNGCDGSIGGTNSHECVLNPGKNILSYK